jgi:AcrR family transcriptional regulator
VEAATDGRHRRSLRSREAVVDALLDLLAETGDSPSAQAVAERAEVSLRTVFRHFDDVDSLFAAAVAQQIERVGALFEPLPAAGDLRTRLAALVDHRAQLFEQIAPVRRAALRRDGHDAIAAWLARSNALLRQQVTMQLAAELDGVSDAVRERTVEALDVMTGFQAWDSMRRDQRLDVDAAKAVVVHAVGRLFDAGS